MQRHDFKATKNDPIIAVLLAGGLSRRMGGGDKSLRRLHGKAIISHVIDRVRPQVDGMMLNANGDPARFRDLMLPVVQDVVPNSQGPLAGVLTAMDWAAELYPNVPVIVTIATDTPFLPRSLVASLRAPLEWGEADIACAASGGRDHPVFAVWPVTLRHELRPALVEEGVRKIDRWTARYRTRSVSFANEPVDPFFNVNTPEDLVEAERLMVSLAGE